LTVDYLAVNYELRTVNSIPRAEGAVGRTAGAKRKAWHLLFAATLSIMRTHVRQKD
jgi:hypothetical protein